MQVEGLVAVGMELTLFAVVLALVGSGVAAIAFLLAAVGLVLTLAGSFGRRRA